ncbi:hypothetical protein V1478_000001 [Vespula squamosa]|uniref:Secreted protein n=1 Tax=Vespula squamosa TaxID=30214 RepID=A0ABD2CA50_VESSQ
MVRVRKPLQLTCAKCCVVSLFTFTEANSLSLPKMLKAYHLSFSRIFNSSKFRISFSSEKLQNLLETY